MRQHSTGLKVIVMALVMITLLLVPVYLKGSFEKTRPFYVGVAFCGSTSADAKIMIDKVKNYTNLFVLQSGPISKNETATNEICEYASAAGLNIIVYFGWFDFDCPWQLPWLDYAKKKWTEHFLGVYYYDEPGGIMLDFNWSRYFSYLKLQNSTMYQSHASAMEAFLNGSLVKDYDLAAKLYVNRIKDDTGINELEKRSIVAFTSDYALYWYDYLGGYDVVLVQLGWNESTAKSIGLTRGAARMQNKPWGAIITWKYTEPPYLDTGEEVYSQLLSVYEAGGEYVTVFNYPCEGELPCGPLAEEHYEALSRFWDDVIVNHKVERDTLEAEAALVLPMNYGWGMRRPVDRNWYWESGERAQQIWNLSVPLLQEYGLLLDIVYDDPAFPVAGKYSKTYYWNSSY